VQRTIGVPDEAPLSAAILSSLGNILVLQRNMKEASEIYVQLDKAMAQWPQQQREVFELNGSRLPRSTRRARSKPGSPRPPRSSSSRLRAPAPAVSTPPPRMERWRSAMPAPAAMPMRSENSRPRSRC
jgi:hypothetical protein